MKRLISSLVLLIAIDGISPSPVVAQPAPALPSPLRLADVVRLASERRDEIQAARARIRAGEARPTIVSALQDPSNLAFSVLVFGELLRAFAARSTTRVFWEVGAFTNVRLFAVVVFSVLMQLGIHHIPAAQAVFEIGPLSTADCVLTLVVALGPVTVIEVEKLVRRWHGRSGFPHEHLA